jgi:hypothetical protein
VNSPLSLREYPPDSLIPDSLIPDSVAHRKAPERSPAAKAKIVYDFTKRTWDGLLDEDYASWEVAYPAINVKAEVAAAGAWLQANPANKKSNYARFITNWLKRQQDGAPKQGGAYQRGSGPVSRGSSQNPDIQAMINAKREQESGN